MVYKKDNFESAHAFVRSIPKKKGKDIDKQLVGWLSGYLMIQLLYIKKTRNMLSTKKLLKNSLILIILEAQKSRQQIGIWRLLLNAWIDIIPFDKLCKMIKTESEYKGEITGDFVMEEMHYKILYPSIITDGNKHCTYIHYN
jgi:hypothetical protein